MTPSEPHSAPLTVHHLNCGTLHAPPYPPAACHCLLLESAGELILIDTGIGLLDVADPHGRLGQPLIDAAGFQFDEAATAARQIERLGFSTRDVKHVVLTHADPDHAGGLADFPAAAVHISAEEHVAIGRGNSRYVPAHFAHEPRWQTSEPAAHQWFGLEARPLELTPSLTAYLIPLFGHTLGHCGVAIQTGDRWLLHAGDAYYLRVEFETDDHPVSLLAATRADDDSLRQASLTHLRRLATDHADEITLFAYHDFSELPAMATRSGSTSSQMRFHL